MAHPTAHLIKPTHADPPESAGRAGLAGARRGVADVAWAAEGAGLPVRAALACAGAGLTSSTKLRDAATGARATALKTPLPWPTGITRAADQTTRGRVRSILTRARIRIATAIGTGVSVRADNTGVVDAQRGFTGAVSAGDCAAALVRNGSAGLRGRALSSGRTWRPVRWGRRRRERAVLRGIEHEPRTTSSPPSAQAFAPSGTAMMSPTFPIFLPFALLGQALAMHPRADGAAEHRGEHPAPAGTATEPLTELVEASGVHRRVPHWVCWAGR
jgi:hypothetical protein